MTGRCQRCGVPLRHPTLVPVDGRLVTVWEGPDFEVRCGGLIEDLHVAFGQSTNGADR